jgi:phosphoglycerate kinase
MNFKSIRDIDVKNKRVLLRIDLNVPVKDGKITDYTRIDRSKETIDYLTSNGARVIMMAHRSEKKGATRDDLSFEFLPPLLKERWGVDIAFASDCIGAPAQKMVGDLKPGQIGLLESMRFHAGEEKNDPAFVREIAALGDIFVNDAFSVSHRAHASTEGLAHILPSAAGLLMEAELKALDKALGNPARPVAAIVGGSKISTKLGVLNNLIGKVDCLILGGAMANTFLYAQGAKMGKSMYEESMANEARTIMANAEKRGCKIILPIDLVTVTAISPNADIVIASANEIPMDRMAIDAGPKSIENALKQIDDCKTVVWNGPMGIFEIKPFDEGTNMLARGVAAKTKSGTIISVAGGGDTVAALENADVTDDFTYISAAGGAFLEWLEGIDLPGVKALQMKKVVIPASGGA